MNASTSSGEKVAVRLSPPLSTSRSCRSGNFASSARQACSFMVVSSRIAVCGQPPVSTPAMRSAGNALCLMRNWASSAINVVGHDRHRPARAHLLAELETEHGLAGAYGAADADAGGAFHGKIIGPMGPIGRIGPMIFKR